MARVSTLYERLQRSPRKALQFRDFKRLLVAFGFTCVRQKGSHEVYEHPAVTRPLIVQPHGNEAKAYQQEFLDMVEAYELSLSE